MERTPKNTIDMTHGTLWDKILLFALPLAASSILQQLVNYPLSKANGLPAS